MAYTKRDRAKWTKSGKLRKGGITATEGRMQMRSAFWEPLRAQLVEHFKTHGNMKRMADTLGISSAMLHQYSCPVCEHDTEASFSVGMGIMLYLSSYREKAAAIASEIASAKTSSECDYQAIPCVRLLAKLFSL